MHPAPPTASGSDDPRIYLDRLSGNWRYEDDEGDEWEWQPFLQHNRPAVDLGETEDDAAPSGSSSHAPLSAAAQPSGHWVKVLDDDLIRAQQAAYSVDGVDESQPAQAVLRRGKKRPASPSSSTSQQAASTADKVPPSKKPKPITSLYVTGLPLDATADEIARVFSRYGVLLEDDSGNPRIKMYHDDRTGMYKGEALVVYFKPESVELAINMLDETNMRAAIGQSSSAGPVMRVQRAEFPTAATDKASINGSAASAPHSSSAANGSQGGATDNNAGGSSGSRRNLSDTDRKKIAKRVARLETKLSDWRDESDSESEPSLASARSAPTNGAGRTVVLTKMFTLFELESDPTLLLDLTDDVREECTAKIGGVTNVVLWDREPEGIITVKFATPAQAAACVQMMNGRFFAQRRIGAFVLSGKPRFKRSGHSGQDAADDSDNDTNDAKHDEQSRRDAFGSWLEQSSSPSPSS